MWIDVHAHHYPPEYLQAFERLGGAVSDLARDLPGSALPLDERVDLLADVGIDLQILSVSQHQPYLPGAANALEAARLANDLFADVCRRYPRHFSAFAAVVPSLIDHTTVKERALFEKAIPSGLRPDPVPNVASIVEDQEWYLAHGYQSQRIDVAAFVDTSFVEQAIRELGPAGR